MDSASGGNNRAQSWASLAFVPIRLALGVIFVAHGGQKLFGLFGGQGFEATVGMFAQMGFVPATLWAGLAGGAEFFGGLSVLLGFCTRVGGLGIAVVMGVAIAKVHWSHGLIGQGGFEYPLANFAAALALVFGGAGPWLSLDSVIWKKR